MTRWIVTLACVLTLAMVALARDADARGYTRKKCIAPEKAQTWVCSAKEKCCYDRIVRQGTCPADRCF
jgi:hypothetical protein